MVIVGNAGDTKLSRRECVPLRLPRARQLFFGSFRASPVQSYRGGANARDEDEWEKETCGRSIGRVGVGVDLFDAMRRGSIRP